eukprot:CAMPEP_0172513318 /NCGR_PEP_ID=MMETSP1066-20121228/251642_1 /TAXON_ID=671091 /ORGANISM="Coscinodiscus wailesii, Strain CCMP2513" /LENGTH=119 /DNA_ID=CAMNT_0013293523 /DNA_START=145 /DNA_END=501 /DNA_ORIENTATION=-
MTMSDDRATRGAIFAESVLVSTNYVAPVVPKSNEVTSFLINSLANNFLFDQLTASEKNEFVGSMKRKTVAAGVTIIRQGDIGDYFYVIEEGNVEFSADGETMSSAGRGESFGELAMIYD